MRKIMVLLAMLLMLSAFAEARQTVVTSANEMKIDLLRYDPSPVQPGDTTDIWFEIINLKSAPIHDFTVSFVEDYPFQAVSDKMLSFSSLDAGGKIQFKFSVRVNENANEAVHNVFIQYYSRSAGSVTSEPFSVAVKRMGSIVSTGVKVSAADAEVPAIAPGGVADIGVSVKNTAGSVMKDITVKLDLSSASMPFAPLGMTAEQRVKQIRPGGEQLVLFKLIALPDAAEGVYKIPVTIKYYDETGSLYNSSEVVGLVVGSVPRLKIAVESSELTKSAKSGKVVLKLINYGTGDVKFAGIMLGAGEDYEIISASEEYIGNVDSDDYETAEFRIKAKKERIKLPVNVSYMDANNRQYEELQYVELVLYNPRELGIKAGYGAVYAAAAIIAGIGYLIYRHRRGKKLLK